MTALLRLDRDTWYRYHHLGTLASAALVAMGAFAVLAFDRFGFPALFQPRSSVRMLLTGFYGWLWLAGAAWVIARFAAAAGTPFAVVFRLFGYAHLPLLIVAITIQFVAVLAQILGPARVVSTFSVIFWLPALLVAATRQAFDLDTPRATLLVAGPYAVWLVVVGRILNDQLGHLL